jgi:hypothetical protein
MTIKPRYESEPGIARWRGERPVPTAGNEFANRPRLDGKEPDLLSIWRPDPPAPRKGVADHGYSEVLDLDERNLR